jgi:hypothetical protein
MRILPAIVRRWNFLTNNSMYCDVEPTLWRGFKVSNHFTLRS